MQNFIFDEDLRYHNCGVLAREGMHFTINYFWGRKCVDLRK